MKRSPLRRKTGLARKTGLKATEFTSKSTKPIAQRSTKRLAEQPQRDEVRRIVWENAGGVCQYAAVIPELPCGFLPGRSILEVDELRGGSRRGTEYLDPVQCRLCCPMHHDYKSLHKKEVNHRLAIHEGRECPFCPCPH